MQECTNSSIEAYRARSMSIDPISSLTFTDIRRTERLKREQRIREALARQETSVDLPLPMSPPLQTEELVAQILPAQQEPFVDKVAGSGRHTVDLIHEAVEELGSIPTLIEISTLRYMALGKLKTRLRYYYNGMLVPFKAADRVCDFDVRVYGYRA